MTKITLGLPLSARQIIEFNPDRERRLAEHDRLTEAWQKRVDAAVLAGDDAGAAEPAPAFDDSIASAVYKFRVPTYTEKCRWREELTAAGLRVVTDSQIVAELRRGIDAIVIPDDRPALHEILDLVEAADRRREPRSPELMAEVAQIENAMLGSWKPYDVLCAQQVRFQQWSGVIAAQLFLVGWENVEPAFQQIRGRVPVELLDALPEHDARAVGDKAVSLLAVSKAQIKNSESPSRSASSREISTTATKPQTEAAGTSTASSTT